MIFEERYAKLLLDPIDKFCGYCGSANIDRIIDVMKKYHMPIVQQLDRYDTSLIWKSDAFLIACENYNKIVKNDFYSGIDFYVDGGHRVALRREPLYRIFSIIELQFDLLSENEKTEYSREMNQLFIEKDIQFRIIDGKIIKIDSKQFECDLRLKALAQMKELKDAEPKFQSAYKELRTAIEDFENGNYQSAINNADKSYESVLKVILDVDRGNTDKLTSQYMDKLLTVPDTMTKTGFREKVMMSLQYLRNNSGVAHGTGSKEVKITKPMAKLAINLAATLDTYLIEEYALRINDNN